MTALALASCNLIYSGPEAGAEQTDAAAAMDAAATDGQIVDWGDSGRPPCEGFIPNSDFSAPLSNWTDHDVELSRDLERELMIIDVENIPDANPKAGYFVNDPTAFAPGSNYELSARVGCDDQAPVGTIQLELEVRGATQADDTLEIPIAFDCARPTFVFGEYKFDETGLVKGEAIQAVKPAIDWTNIVEPEAVWEDRVLVDDFCYRLVE